MDVSGCKVDTDSFKQVTEGYQTIYDSPLASRRRGGSRNGQGCLCGKYVRLRKKAEFFDDRPRVIARFAITKLHVTMRESRSPSPNLNGEEGQQLILSSTPYTKMADVRSMLRNERASRRITHPDLTYTPSGNLVCSLCHIQLKSEALWTKHIQSTQHTSRLRNRRDDDNDSDDNDSSKKLNGETQNSHSSEHAVATAAASTSMSKKRKADDSSSDNDDTRKRSRPQQASPGKVRLPSPVDLDPPQTTQSPPFPPSQNIDEAEWAAFERDVAATAPSALTAAADISAAPLSAVELAARSREEASTQGKEAREAEGEGEQEDAARRMEEELEEMAQLEERVRRLREKREALRVRKGVGEEERILDEEGRGEGDGGGGVNGVGEVEESEDEDDDGDDGWGSWGR